MNRIDRAARIALFALGAWTTSVFAGTTEDAWQFELTPYLWATRMNGEVQTSSIPTTQVDMRFSDVLKGLDMGFMSAFEARKGRWAFLADEMYMKVSESASTTSADGSMTVDSRAHVKQTMVAGALAYRTNDGAATIDMIGGARYSRIYVEANIDAALVSATGTINRSGTKAWTEPYLGLQVGYPLAEKLQGIVYGDVGGFGIGSDFTWQGMLGLRYEYSTSLTMTLGYRYMDVDFDKDGFRYKMANDGIYSGLALRF